MPDTKFEESKASGAHALLAKLTGEWQGVSRTWFEPGVLADESPIQGSLRLVLDGRFALHEYTSSLQGQPFEGLALYGCNLGLGRFEAAWADSFHNGTAIMFSVGERKGEDFSALGGYPDFSGGPDWGWRTEIEVLDEDHIVITMYNITPEGEEAKAVEVAYTRRR